MRKIKYPVTITSKITGKTKDNLDKVSEVMELSLSELIRMILEEYTT